MKKRKRKIFNIILATVTLDLESRTYSFFALFNKIHKQKRTCSRRFNDSHTI